MAIVSQKLTDIQIHLLRYFSERKVSDGETVEIQRMIANYYAKKGDDLMDKIWEEKGYNDEKIQEILNSPLKK